MMNNSFKVLRNALVVLLAGVFALTGCQSSKEDDEVIVTSIDEVVNTVPKACQAQFQSLAQDLVGEKSAYLVKNAEFMPSSSNNEEFVPPTNLASYSGTLIYNDRPSHLVVETRAIGKACAIRYELDYQLDIPCVEAREEAFRKWQPAGEMGNLTRFYRHQHYPYKTAYLTHITNDTQCLIRVQVDVPNDSQESEGVDADNTDAHAQN